MRHHHEIALALRQEHARELHRAAADDRLARRARRHAVAPQAGLRQRLGRSLVRIGSRLAADADLEPARSP